MIPWRALPGNYPCPPGTHGAMIKPSPCHRFFQFQVLGIFKAPCGLNLQLPLWYSPSQSWFSPFPSWPTPMLWASSCAMTRVLLARFVAPMTPHIPYSWASLCCSNMTEHDRSWGSHCRIGFYLGPRDSGWILLPQYTFLPGKTPRRFHWKFWWFSENIQDLIICMYVPV